MFFDQHQNKKNPNNNDFFSVRFAKMSCNEENVVQIFLIKKNHSHFSSSKKTLEL